MATPEAIESEVSRILDAFGPHPGHVFNLGHGIGQQTPPENVAVLIEAVSKLSRTSAVSIAGKKVEDCA
jgi:uroporphyrinogen decarboxylase